MNLFSYESKPMQILMFLGDLIILNVLYIICSIPIFTIGAAQAGLYTALRVLTDPEDDSSPAAALFRGFKNGFGAVTVAWGLLELLIVVTAFFGFWGYYNGLPIWIAIVAVSVVALLQSMIPLFHSQFSCTAMQLIRNAFLMSMLHPLRTLGVAVLICLPVVLALWSPYFFMSSGVLWVAIYYSGACLFAATFMKKPFASLIKRFNQAAENQENTGNEESETEEITQDQEVIAQ